MTTLLTDQAADLCRRLYLAQLEEEARRDRAGQRIGDARRIARLVRLRRLAADRWRRRAGYGEHARPISQLVGLPGVILVATNHDGLVTWCSDWTRIDEAPGVRRVFHGPATYGHISYYLDQEGGRDDR